MPSPKLKTRPEADIVRAWQFDAIGTRWWLGIFEPVSERFLRTLKRAILARIEQFDQTYSRFRPDSWVTRIATQGGDHVLPPDSQPLLRFYRQLYEASGGAVTPLVGNLLVAAGYDAQYSFLPGKLNRPLSWEAVLAEHQGHLSVAQPVLLDFGAAGKGYLVDLIVELLRSHGLRHFCVDASGDMYLAETGLRTIGLEHPDDPSQAIGVVKLDNQALCASAGNRRMWGKYHHIMNPFTLDSARSVKAVWVLADDTLTADGLATALFLVPPNHLTQFSFEYLMIDAHNQLSYSSKFPVTLFREEVGKI